MKDVKSNSPEEDLASFEQAIRLNPNNVDAYINKGKALMALFRYEEALVSFEQAIQLNPNNADVYNNKGTALFALKRYEEALASFEQAIRLNPNNVDAHINKGKALTALFRFEEALASFDQAVRLDPRLDVAYNNRGVALWRLGKFEEALASFEQAIQLNPINPGAYSMRGLIYFTREQYDLALNDFNHALELNPTADTFTMRGRTYYALQQYEHALADFNYAIELDSTNTEAYNNRGNVYRGLGDYERALADFNKAIELNPSDVEIYNNRGNVYSNLKEYEQALEDYNKAIELDANSAEAYNNKGKALTALGRDDEARTFYQRAADISGQSGDQVPEKSQTVKQIEELIQVQSESINIAIRALADTPSDIDLLKFSDYADALVDFIKSEKTQKPLTIAIDAAWGMGKTTLMRMIQNRLEGKADKEKQESSPTQVKRDQKEPDASAQPSFPIVWFNAWQYDQEDSLWAALALEILEQVGKQFTLIQKAGFWWNLTQKRLGKRNLFFKIAFRLLPFIVGLIILLTILFAVAWLWQGNTLINSLKRIFLPLAGTLGAVTLIYASIKDIYSRFIKPLDQRIAQYVSAPNYKDRIGFLAQFKEDFSSIVEAATSEGKWPLIIFIDDLDRCAPSKAVEIIEAINLLLDVRYCVFVMGMDMDTVAGSIEAKYQELLTYLGTIASPGELNLGQRFLEKIIQITFHLPRADTMVVQSFIDTILTGTKESIETSPSSERVQKAAQLIEAEQRVGKPLDAAADAVKQTRADISDNTLKKAKEEVFAKSFDDSQIVQQVIRQVAPYLELNPRKIKRFINAFRLQALIANRRGLLEREVVKLDVLAKWIMITSRWPSIVNALHADKDFIKRLKEAYDTANTISQERLKYQPGRTGPGNYEEYEASQVRSYQAKLETYSADVHIKLLIDAADLLHLLSEMTDADLEAWPVYLHLTQSTRPGA